MDKLNVFDEVRHKAHQGGGEEKVAMQHNLEKMTARERILNLLDEGSFIEVGGLMKKNGAGVITGHGTIGGRLVYVYSEDYTVEGASFNGVVSKKICNIMDEAAKMGAPIIKIFDSIGGKVSEGLELLASYGNILRKSSKLSGVVPQISMVAGPCNGTMAMNATLSDFTVVVKNISELSVSTNDSLRIKEALHINNNCYSGDGAVKSGNAHFAVENEMEAIETIKKIFDFIPSNNLEGACLGEECSDLNIAKEELNNEMENETFTKDSIVNAISDSNSVLEINKCEKTAISTYFIKLNGLTVGVVATGNEQSELNVNISNKVSKFVRLCDSFNIPVLTIVDTKAFVVSLEEEKNGLASNVAKMVYAFADATVPKVALVTGEAYGAGYLAFASKEVAFDKTIAWPTAKISLKSNETKEVADPYLAAEVGLIDDIIKPSETKQVLFAMFDMLQTKRELEYPKKHGSTLV